MSEDEQQVPGRVAAEDYRRQRQEAEHGRDGFGQEIRNRFAEFRSAGRDRLIELARVYSTDDREAIALADELLDRNSTGDISQIDEPSGHQIISNIVASIEKTCAQVSMFVALHETLGFLARGAEKSWSD